jgi:pimeloyl-ACP methyl ester carboxylesterase
MYRIKTDTISMSNSVKLRKSITIVTASFLILILNQCTTHNPSPISVRPNNVPDGVVLKSVGINGLEADFFYGTSSKPYKALIMLGGSEGGRYWSYQPEFIYELIDQGYCVLSLPYFGTKDLPKNLRGIPLEYFSKAFRWLSTQTDLVVPDQYALVGVSRGAELALLLGSRYPEVKAVVAIAPSSVIFPGPPTGLLDIFSGQHSAWSENGQELAFVPLRYSLTTLRGMISGKRTRMFEEALRDTLRVRSAAIPAEKIQGAVLLVSFTRDQIWPSTIMSEQIMERLHTNSFGFYFEHDSYNGVHSEWTIEPCREKILSFLKEHFLTLSPD